MKKIVLTIIFTLILSLTAVAQSKRVVTDSITFMPNQVQIHEGITKNGNPKWWIEFPTTNGNIKKVTLSQSHVTSNRLLALIERRDPETGKYYYSIKFAEPKKSNGTGKIDLSIYTNNYGNTRNKDK